jgi:hypothetical protein
VDSKYACLDAEVAKSGGEEECAHDRLQDLGGIIREHQASDTEHEE